MIRTCASLAMTNATILVLACVNVIIRSLLGATMTRRDMILNMTDIHVMVNLIKHEDSTI